ncbi:uncharacterized protein TrAFT101_003407 [Trichoderma asperellum]|uniref:uncharacterized protein n=1 Tax=Trichoderma asperellum TaxID=101201 RepID=UPI003319BA2B|nr:hypothetical protein TrAFT101_003407 [Trichoderma asperellum]
MACAPARPRPARGALGQSAPRCPAVATVDIGFFKAAHPRPREQPPNVALARP